MTRSKIPCHDFERVTLMLLQISRHMGATERITLCRRSWFIAGTHGCSALSSTRLSGESTN